MAFETATFNPEQFELRNYTNSYLSPEQSDAVTLVESRVNGQLDFLAQMLGWNGQNYWTNLPDTPDQKRQLLAGSFGLYNGFHIPRILEIRNWNNTIVIEKLPVLRPPIPSERLVDAVRVVLGDDIYKIQELSVEGDTYVVSLGKLPQSFYDQIAANVQLKVLIPSTCPAPFFRGNVGASGDASFRVFASGTNLTLCPDYDTDQRFPYESLSLFANSVYYFNQPVYAKYSLTNLVPDISPTYDPINQVWFFQVPDTIVKGTAPITIFLCWDYSNSTSAVTCFTQVRVQNWFDCSDWISIDTINNFTGSWGNKGGPLPYNLAFDSLSIHGVSENNALRLPVIERSLSYNSLMEQVYAQLTPYDITAPGSPKIGDLWWNPETGALSVWYDPFNQGCAVWVEIDYRNQPNEEIVATLVYPDVPAYTLAAPAISPGTTVLILDCTNLDTTANIIGLTGTITSSPSLYLYQEVGSPYWTAYKFVFTNVSDFSADADILPFNVPCTIANAINLVPSSTNYSISNLTFEVLQPLPALLTKLYSVNNWEISPDSILRYISQSALFGYENQGEMWWDTANPFYSTRAASIFIQNAWVSVNLNSLSGSPTYFFDATALRFYSDGVLLTPGLDYATDNYIIQYIYNNITKDYDFTYTPITLDSEANLPTLEVSDSLESTYRIDITQLIFSGVLYTLTPSIADSETTLRVWKTQELQGTGTVAHLVENNYINPLLADMNSGPNVENWERYFIRLPLDYERNGMEWQKTALICQNFGYWGSSIEPEFMRCPPEDDVPAIYEELFLYDQPIQDYTYVYAEPYLYSNIAYANIFEIGEYRNAGFFPASDDPYDGYMEGMLIEYDPLHNRLADTSSPVGSGYGDWEGIYVNVNACTKLSGFLLNDLGNKSVEPVAAPIWDASIYKLAPTCQNEPTSYTVDSNHYKVGYAYFVADASAAEDGFFDPQQPVAWRYPVKQPRTGYITSRPGVKSFNSQYANGSQVSDFSKVFNNTSNE